MDYATQNKISRRVKQLKRDGVAFLAGTVAPAESDAKTDDIESLEKALQYFKEKDVPIVHIQPKWMGSRVQFYLSDNIGDCYAVTRNGFRLRKESMEELTGELDAWRQLITYMSEHGYKKISRIILDGELLPWSSLGCTLIEREFVGLSTCVSSEADILEELGMSDALDSVVQSADYESAMVDFFQGTFSRKDLAKKYNRYETYDNIQTVLSYDIEQERNDLKLYEQQLDLYGTDAQLQYKPFDILRIEYEDGSIDVPMAEELYSPIKQFSFLRHFEYDVFGSVPDLEWGITASVDNLEDVTSYFNRLQDAGYEGIMIKPVRPNKTDAVNCMKVRNKEYLRIIYGYDYQRPEVLRQLVEKKRVGRKRKLSHHEYKLGKEMLQLDPNAIDFDEQFDKIAAAILFEIEEEQNVDKRL